MSGTNGYADIANHYRKLIVDGTLAPGDAMPSMREVREKFDVTITTVNRAFGLLKSEGLTYPKRGVGTVVTTRARTAMTGAARIDRLESTGRQYAHKETSTGHRSSLRSCADPQIASELEVELYDEIVVRERVFLQDGRPTVAALSLINMRALTPVPELLQQGQLKPFWHKLYEERTRKAISRSPECRTARMASSNELELLDVAAPEHAAVPVLVLQTTFHDEDGPIEVWQDVLAPGLWQADTQ